MGLLERAKLELTELKSMAKIVPNLPRLVPFGNWNPARLLWEWAEKDPNGLALAYEDERYTWRDVNDRANQYADFFIKHGIGKGEVVALMMDNRPDFVFIVMGLNKIRAVSALINTNLTGKGLTHAMNVGRPRMVIAGSEHIEAVLDVADDLETVSRDHVFQQVDKGSEEKKGARAINDEVAGCQKVERSRDHRPSTGEAMCYIYTSGTTGLPKAAVITNQREIVAGTAFGKIMIEGSPEEVVYVPLPLYHSSAMFIGWGSCLTTGAAMALRRKFSATKFWDDINEFGATRFVYIGELCRYLLNQPSKPNERTHRVEVAVGNGLRPDIWEKFQDRFNVPLIREFYGATEGNAPLFNVEGKPGMIGRLRAGQTIIKCDPSTGEVIRDKDGLCRPVKAGEQGLLLGKISPVMKFDGYVDEQATEKKVIRNVLKKGDAYFNTGDVIALHEDKWCSFVDRVGDTFRWKGENVSTNEVAEILNGAKGVLEANVYGVKVPNADGRAGMASINVNDEFGLDSFASYVIEKLPNYMRPHFIRIQHEMRITGTFKHQKVDYREEGFDPNKVSDPLYFLDPDKEEYVEIDQALYQKIEKGEIAPR